MGGPWPELPLDAWRETCDTLHLWTQIPGKIRLARSPPEPDWGHVTLYVTVSGLTTSPIPDGERTFQLDFDFLEHALLLSTSDGRARSIPLAPQTVKSFYRETFDALASLGIHVEIWPKPQEVPDPIPLDEDEVHAAYDAEWVGRWFDALRRIDLVMKEYRGRFEGRTTPVHFFWGSFDLAVTRYLGGHVLSAGFWPGDARFPEAAFFAFTAPKPDELERAALRPAAAFWSDDMGLFMLRYDDVRTAASPRETLLDFFESSYEAGAALVSPTGQETPVPPSPQ
jgi:Family of unknown function (DUF5996)